MQRTPTLESMCASPDLDSALRREEGRMTRWWSRATAVVGALLPLLVCYVPQQCVPAMYEVISALYDTLASAASEVASASPPPSAIPSGLRRLAMLVCQDLSVRVYAHLSYSEDSEKAAAAGVAGDDDDDDNDEAGENEDGGSSHSKRRSKGAKRLKQQALQSAAAKQRRLVPLLIRAIETWETRLLELANRVSDATIMTVLRRSTARDFRLDPTKLARALEAASRSADAGAEAVVSVT